MTDYVSEPANLYGANPELMGRIIAQMKSKGSFDQLRKEILADIDTKPAYQNLRQRLENTVNRYLRNQKWNSAIIKNKLRDSLRRHLTDGNFIHVAPVLNQVLTPDLCSQVAPEVDKEICKELGVGEDEEEPEQQSPSNGRRDGGWDGEGGSGHGFGGREHDFHGGRHNGRVWRNESDFFYPYGGAGYNRFSRRGGRRDAEHSSDDDNSVEGEEKHSLEDKNIPANPLSKFDDLDFEYSKDEVVELNRRDNPEWVLQQHLAAQKFKIEEELQRMELEELRKQEITEQQKQIVEEQRQLQLMEERQQQWAAEQAAMASKFRPIAPLIEPEPEIEEVLEEPKTPEMSDGEDSDVPEMQIVEDEEDESRTSSKDMVIDEAVTPTEVTPLTEPEPATPPAKSEPDEVFKVPETEIKPKTPEVVEKQEEIVAEEPKVVEKLKESSKEDPLKKRRDERSKSKDDRQKSDQRKEHSSSSSSSSSRRHSSSSSSKSSSHKRSSSSSSSKQESSSSKSGSSSSRSKDEKSSSHRSSSSRRDSERYKSSSRSSSHRKDDKYRSKSSLYKKGEDANNLYYFGEEQTLELAKSRGHLDEVMIRLELDTGGYESLISESENEEESTESYSYQLELNRTEALNVRNLLDIDIPGLDEQEEAEHSVPMFEEINANEIMKSPILEKVVFRKTGNGGWNHVDNVGENEVNHIRENSGKRRLSVNLDKSPIGDLKSAKLAAPSPPPMESPAPVKRKRIVRKMEQRYSTDDLYKPRPTFTTSRRSRE